MDTSSMTLRELVDVAAEFQAANDPDQALAHYRFALETLAELTQEPNGQSSKRFHQTARLWLSIASLTRTGTNAHVDALENALRYSSRSCNMDQSRGSLITLAEANAKLGIMYLNDRKWPESEIHLRNAIDHYGIAISESDDVAVRRSSSLVKRHLGYVLNELGYSAEAASITEDSVETFRGLRS